MYQYITFFGNQIKAILEMLNTASINLNGFTVGFVDLLFGFLAIGMVISIFWRGART